MTQHIKDTPMRELTAEEKDMLWIALNIRNNYIETGNISYSAVDLEKFSEKYRQREKLTTRALNRDQMKLLSKSKELVKKVLQNKIFIVED